MTQEWRTIAAYPQYEVSRDGLIRSVKTGIVRTPTTNQFGAAKMNLMKDGAIYTVAVNHIVAETYLDPPKREDFDTIIHLNGDRSDCRASNLMWRPRHFAIKFHQQFEYEGFKNSNFRIQDVKTERIYERAPLAAIEHGLIYQQILISIHYNTYVWPTYQTFRHVD